MIIPNGFNYPTLKNYYFLGYDNSTIHFVILGLYILIFASHYLNKKISLLVWIMLFIAGLSYFKLWTASCMICLLIVIFFLLFVYKKNLFKKFFNYKVLIGIFTFLFLLIVVFKGQEIFSWLIVNILHKRITLTGRTWIWDRCFKQILAHPIFGLGVQNYITRMSTINIYHAHCTILNILLEGGIVSLIAFLNIFRVIGKEFSFENNKKTELISICSFAIFTYFISSLVDVIDNTQMTYIIFNLCFYSMYLYNKEKVKKNKKNILIISGGHLPIPAIMGGAVETLTESYISENDRVFHENIDVLSVNVPFEYQHLVSEYKYTNFIYVGNQSKKSLYNIWCRVLGKLHIYIGNYYLNKGINKIKNLGKEYDVILCENEPLFTMKLKDMFDSKIILHLHNNYLNPSKKFYKKIINSCDKIFAVSDYIKEQVNSDKCITVYNGIDFSLFKKEDIKVSQELRKKYKIKKDDFVFIFVGRIVPEKGIDDLITSFLKLNKKYKNIKLLIIGSPSFKDKSTSDFYNKMLSMKNNNIIFTGFVDNNELYKYYYLANVSVVPSKIDEAFGLTVVEAIISKKRVIVSDFGALPEIVNEKIGRVVNSNNLIKNLYTAMEDEYLNCYKSRINKDDLKIYSKEEYAKRIYDNLEV